MFVEFTVYNANVNLFCLVTLTLETSALGMQPCLRTSSGAEAPGPAGPSGAGKSMIESLFSLRLHIHHLPSDGEATTWGLKAAHPLSGVLGGSGQGGAGDLVMTDVT